MDQWQRISGGLAADDEYWRSLAAGEFKLPRCATCDRWIWPANYRCGDCGSWEMQWVGVVPEGHVYSWSRMWSPSEGILERATDIPYVTILAELPTAGNARVFGVLIGEDEGLRIDAPVRGVIEPPSPKSKGYPAVRWRLV